jgi:hypothetical protein
LRCRRECAVPKAQIRRSADPVAAALEKSLGY